MSHAVGPYSVEERLVHGETRWVAIRARGFGHGALYRFEGSYFPFPETASERVSTSDPRPAILERYPDQAAYLRAIGHAARELATAGLMLDEDVERAIAAAKGWGQPRHVVALR